MVKKIDNAIISAKTLATAKLAALKEKATGDETLIIKIMLMVIAVVLVLLFRNSLETIIKNLLTGVNEKITNMYQGTVTPIQ